MVQVKILYDNYVTLHANVARILWPSNSREFCCSADDALPAAPETSQKFIFPLASVSDVPRLKTADVPEEGWPHIVAIAQDVWHVKQRLDKAAPSKAPDRAAFFAVLQDILRLGSAKHSGPITASCPKDLLAQLIPEATALQSRLLGLIAKFEKLGEGQTAPSELRQRVESAGAKLHAARKAQSSAPSSGKRAVGARSGPTAQLQAEAAAARAEHTQQQRQQASLTAETTLADANQFQEVRADEVCNCMRFLHKLAGHCHMLISHRKGLCCKHLHCNFDPVR